LKDGQARAQLDELRRALDSGRSDVGSLRPAEHVARRVGAVFLGLRLQLEASDLALDLLTLVELGGLRLALGLGRQVGGRLGRKG
jgi:hypothetical protein